MGDGVASAVGKDPRRLAGKGGGGGGDYVIMEGFSILAEI